MRKFLIIISIFLFSIGSIAQNTFKGKLVSALTGKPINGALIESNGKLCASTDSLGNFTLELDSANRASLLFMTVESGNIEIAGLDFKKDEVFINIPNARLPLLSQHRH